MLLVCCNALLVYGVVYALVYFSVQVFRFKIFPDFIAFGKVCYVGQRFSLLVTT